jgi:hypothetical protein
MIEIRIVIFLLLLFQLKNKKNHMKSKDEIASKYTNNGSDEKEKK